MGGLSLKKSKCQNPAFLWQKLQNNESFALKYLNTSLIDYDGQDDDDDDGQDDDDVEDESKEEAVEADCRTHILQRS